MTLSKQLSLVLGLQALCGVALCGCSSGEEEDENALKPENQLIPIAFSPMYSAWDGVHDYKVPATVGALSGGVHWSVSEEGIVDLEATSENSVMITTRQPGTVDIIARAGNLWGKSTLTITDGSIKEGMPDLWELGNQRYNNGIPAVNFDLSMLGNLNIDELRRDPQNALTQFIADNSACTECHSASATSNGTIAIPIDVEHTPMQTGGYSDQDLANIFTQGRKPEGVGIRTEILRARPEVWSSIHQWQMTEEEAFGIILYLRSLAPKDQGSTINFGGFMGGGLIGGGGGPPPPPAPTEGDGTMPPSEPPPEM